MAKPFIGATTYRTYNQVGNPQLCGGEAYISSLLNAGANPILIPLGLGNEQLDELIDHLDGVLFTGGGDIHPHQYKSENHPRVGNIDRDRDRVEIHLLSSILARKLPFFGICRGLQLINVALGGDLYTDLQDQYPGALPHDSPDDWPRDRLIHPVAIQPKSRLCRIVGQDSLQVNSLHHQGIKDLGTGLIPTAVAPDGIIECVEVDDRPFGLAVQWHPEWLQAHSSMRALFRSFVQSAKSYKEK